MRVFFCVPVPRDVKSSIGDVAKQLRARARMRATWVHPENYHLTLRFLGDIDPMLAVPLESACRRVAQKASPFSLRVDRVGAFPNEQRPRVVWAGGESGPFASLAQALNDAIEVLGFPIERRPAAPHVTLARIKGRPDPDLPSIMSSVKPLPGWDLIVDRVLLMESRLTPNGAVYSPLFSVRLAGEPMPGGMQ